MEGDRERGLRPDSQWVRHVLCLMGKFIGLRRKSADVRQGGTWFVMRCILSFTTQSAPLSLTTQPP